MLLKEDKIEKREYQIKIANTCLKGNTLVVLPTGLGKTIIAILVTAKMLEEHPNKKVLVLAPTRPLVEQHFKTFKELLNEDLQISITGKIRPEKRQQYYRKYKIIFATPQVIRNDLIAERINPKDFCLVIFDECHKAVGNYPYVFIAKEFVRKNPEVRIIGLTASPGGSLEKIRQIMKNLFIKYIEVRTDSSPDVKPYIKGIKIRWEFVNLLPEMKYCVKLIEDMEKFAIKQLKEMGYVYEGEKLYKKKLLKLKRQVLKDFVKNKVKARNAYMLINELLKLHHIKELIESQGVIQAREYIRYLIRSVHEGRFTRYLRSIVMSPRFQELMRVLKDLSDRNIIHPKIDKLKEILGKENYRKTIIFTQLKITAKIIKRELEKLGYKVIYFAGQSEVSQKEQTKLIEDFKEKDYNIMVATSVAEEGLDIPEVDLVIFYEPIPSEIRTIQRRGRTGRKVPGKVIILVSEGIDEAYYWSSYYKEKRMKELLGFMKAFGRRDEKHYQFTIDEVVEEKCNGLLKYFEGEKMVENVIPKVIVDDREMKSPVVEKIKEEGVKVEIKRLEVGDYIVGDIVIERKRADDFVKSILDNRLFEQVKQLQENSVRSIIIIEGDVLSAGLRPEPIYGAIQSILIDYGIPVIFTTSSEETGLFIAILAKRIAKEKREEKVVTKKPKDIPTIQERILMQFPGIGIKKARLLLQTFGSLKDVFNAEYIKLRDVLGEALAKKFKDILEYKYNRKAEER